MEISETVAFHCKKKKNCPHNECTYILPSRYSTICRRSDRNENTKLTYTMFNKPTLVMYYLHRYIILSAIRVYVFIAFMRYFMFESSVIVSLER